MSFYHLSYSHIAKIGIYIHTSKPAHEEGRGCRYLPTFVYVCKYFNDYLHEGAKLITFYHDSIRLFKRFS